MNLPGTADSERHTVNRKKLQQHIRTIVRRLVPLGPISLRALREELQLNLGTSLVSHKAEIRCLAEHALRELTLEQQLVPQGFAMEFGSRFLLLWESLTGVGPFSIC